MKKMFLILLGLCFGFVVASAQQPTVTISLQSNGSGIIRVGGNYTNADHIAIDCLNKTDNTKISNQNCVIVSGGKWYYDKPVVAGKVYKFAVRAWKNNGSEKWAELDNITAAPIPGPMPPVPPVSTKPKPNPQIQIRYVVNDTYEYAEFVDGKKKAPTGSSGWSLGVEGNITTLGPGAAVQLAYSTNRDYIYGIQYFPSKTTKTIKVNYFPKSEFGDYITLYGNSYPTEKGSGDNRKVIIGDGAHHYYILARYLGTQPRN